MHGKSWNFHPSHEKTAWKILKIHLSKILEIPENLTLDTQNWTLDTESWTFRIEPLSILALSREERREEGEKKERRRREE